jgi:hypothetical protein
MRIYAYNTAAKRLNSHNTAVEEVTELHCTTAGACVCIVRSFTSFAGSVTACFYRSAVTCAHNEDIHQHREYSRNHTIPHLDHHIGHIGAVHRAARHFVLGQNGLAGGAVVVEPAGTDDGPIL